MRSSKSRSRSKSNRPRPLGNIINRVFDSSGPEGKVRGTPQQIIEKYLVLARDAQLSHDRVAAEAFLQHAEHYTRMLSEAQREMAAEQEARQQQNQHNQQHHAHGQNQNQNQNHQPRRDDRREDRRETVVEEPSDEMSAALPSRYTAPARDEPVVTEVETPAVEDQPAFEPAAEAPAAAPRARRPRAPREPKEGDSPRRTNTRRPRVKREDATDAPQE